MKILTRLALEMLATLTFFAGLFLYGTSRYSILGELFVLIGSGMLVAFILLFRRINALTNERPLSTLFPFVAVLVLLFACVAVHLIRYVAGI